MCRDQSDLVYLLSFLGLYFAWNFYFYHIELSNLHTDKLFYKDRFIEFVTKCNSDTACVYEKTLFSEF